MLIEEILSSIAFVRDWIKSSKFPMSSPSIQSSFSSTIKFFSKGCLFQKKKLGLVGVNFWTTPPSSMWFFQKFVFERERERETVRQKERERERDRETQRERKRERDREREKPYFFVTFNIINKTRFSRKCHCNSLSLERVVKLTRPQKKLPSKCPLIFFENKTRNIKKSISANEVSSALFHIYVFLACWKNWKLTKSNKMIS